MTPVTIILSIKVQDGVVMASDSAVLHRGHLYSNAEKNIQLIKGLPIGVLISGDGAVGSRALTSVMHDFSVRAGLRGSACFVDEAWRADDDVGRGSFSEIEEVEQVVAFDGVTGGADVDPVAGRRSDAFVPRLVEAAIAFDDAEVRVAEARPDEVERPIRRTAVHDDDLVREIRPCRHRREVPFHQRSAVIGGDDHAECRLGCHKDAYIACGLRNVGNPILIEAF